MEQKIIDFHVHIFNQKNVSDAARELVEKAWGAGTSAYLDHYRQPVNFSALCQDNGLSRAVVLAEYCPGITYIFTNEEIAEFCKEAPEAIPFANINPYLVPDPARELVYCVERLGCRGLKLLPSYQNWSPVDPRMYPLYGKAQEMEIPVMFHTGSSIFPGARLKYADPLLLDDVATDFPRLTIVQAHSGRGFWYDRAFFLARLHKNMYMEISGLPPRNLLKYFPDFERNADKIIFGSDWPSTGSIKKLVEAIEQLPLTPESKEKILWRNAARVLRLENF